MPGPEASDSVEDILRHIRLHGEPFVSAGDIEPKMTVGYKQARNRLDDLVDEGYLNMRKVGNVNLYWLTDKGKQRLVAAES